MEIAHYLLEEVLVVVGVDYRSLLEARQLLGAGPICLLLARAATFGLARSIHQRPFDWGPRFILQAKMNECCRYTKMYLNIYLQ